MIADVIALTILLLLLLTVMLCCKQMTSLVLFWPSTAAVWRLWPWAALKVHGLEVCGLINILEETCMTTDSAIYLEGIGQVISR